jgi:hypothetical protein
LFSLFTADDPFFTRANRGKELLTLPGETFTLVFGRLLRKLQQAGEALLRRRFDGARSWSSPRLLALLDLRLVLPDRLGGTVPAPASGCVAKIFKLSKIDRVIAAKTNSFRENGYTFYLFYPCSIVEYIPF